MIANNHWKFMSNFVVTVPADGLALLGTRASWWFSARKTWLQCISNGVTSFLHLLINLNIQRWSCLHPTTSHESGIWRGNIPINKCSRPIYIRPNLVFIVHAKAARMSEGAFITTMLITSVLDFHWLLRYNFADQTRLFKIAMRSCDIWQYWGS